MKEVLGFATLLGYLQTAIASMHDPRRDSPNRQYSLLDVVLGTFGMFFLQCESFLEYQRQLHNRKGQDNAQTLFGVEAIGSDNQIRNVLDSIDASVLFGVFKQVYQRLKESGYLNSYKVLDGQLLVALDGTEYFSSQCIHCGQCSQRTQKNGSVTYFHSAILPVIVAPDNEHVISLDPEFIRPQNGHDKQDCEQAAAKRWLHRHSSWFKGTGVTLLGDDLYSRHPMCELANQHNFHYLFVCLPESHPGLSEWLAHLERIGKLHCHQQRQRHGRNWHVSTYRWVNGVLLRDAQPAIEVNWCELILRRAADDQVIDQNAWITDHHLSADNVAQVVAAARACWKTENENHNVLKTKGYHLEHNFGHGQQHLASFLLTLNLLAFLFHTVVHLVDSSYQQLRRHLGTRQRFFNDLRALTVYLVFDSWQHLLSFMLSGFAPPQPPNSSSFFKFRIAGSNIHWCCKKLEKR